MKKTRKPRKRPCPAQFLIDSGGVFRWVNLSGDMSVRVSPEDILKVIDELSVVSSSARN